jgi:hypothetical protein
MVSTTSNPSILHHPAAAALYRAATDRAASLYATP